jgi:gamma-glutamylcyclotransferase (GGCT)/AIG2-like uncharacterized protein YtfP
MVVNTKHKIFVDGTLKKEHGNNAHNRYLSDATWVGRCCVPGVMVHLGHYPGLVDDKVCWTTGEVYEVDAVAIHQMDQYEGTHNGNYTRKAVKTPFGNAWVYYKNHVPNPLPPNLICVARGLWLGGEKDKASYYDVCDFYKNKRWLEPVWREMPQQGIYPDATHTPPGINAKEPAKEEGTVDLKPKVERYNREAGATELMV